MLQLWQLWRHDEYLVHQVEYTLQHTFWIINHLVINLGRLTDTPMGNIVGWCFVWLGGFGHKSKVFLIYQHSTSNLKSDFVVFDSLNVVKSEKKISKHHPLKITRSHFILILSISVKNLELVSIFRAKNKLAT